PKARISREHREFAASIHKALDMFALRPGPVFAVPDENDSAIGIKRVLLLVNVKIREVVEPNVVLFRPNDKGMLQLVEKSGRGIVGGWAMQPGPLARTRPRAFEEATRSHVDESWSVSGSCHDQRGERSLRRERSTRSFDRVLQCLRARHKARHI